MADWISGFCNPSNPDESHARCDLHPRADGVPCTCPHHTTATDTEVLADEPGPRLGVYDDLDELAYHADPTSVSASGMKELLRSPAHFLHSLTHPERSAAMDLGTVAHSLILGAGAEFVAIDGNRNRNDVKAAIAEAEAEGKVVLKPAQFAAAERMADAVLRHPKAERLLASPGRSEVSMFARDERFDIIRRCRWDRLTDDGIGVDLKTTGDVNPDQDNLSRHIAKYGYDLSAAWYLDVAAGLDVDLAAYALVFVESSEPHPVVVVELSDEFLLRGAALAEKALTVYRRCLDTGAWPAYCDDDFLIIGPPRWAETPEQITSTIPERTPA